MTTRTRKNTRCIAALVAVVLAVGLTVPLLAAERSTSSTSLGSVDPTTMDIFAGLNTPATGEDPASAYLPPGQGGTPPGKPEGPGSESRPPLFANNDKDKDKDKDKDQEEEDENED
jgi:hypothetical protein